MILFRIGPFGKNSKFNPEPYEVRGCPEPTVVLGKILNPKQFQNSNVQNLKSQMSNLKTHPVIRQDAISDDMANPNLKSQMLHISNLKSQISNLHLKS